MQIPPTTVLATVNDERAALRPLAVKLEAGFLAEMLKAGGLGKSRELYGGGVGEDAFSSLLVQQQAKLMAEGGGIGLAEHIVDSLMKGRGND